MAVFIKGCPEGVDELGTLVHEPFAGAKQDGATLLLGAFGLDEAPFQAAEPRSLWLPHRSIVLDLDLSVLL